MLDMRNNAVRVPLAAVICAIFCATLVHAQAGAGAISGITVDDFRNPVAQVEITVQNSANGVQYHAASGPQGEFTVSGLPAGTYDISAVVHGARLFQQKNIVVGDGQSVRIDARLVDANINAIGDNPFAAAAMEHRAIPAGPTPRALDGHPDLSGVWSTARQISVTETELLPWAQAEMKRPNRMSPNAFCLPQGPRLGAANPFKFIQSPKTIVALIEDIFTYRQIHMDGRARPKDVDPSWMGYSIGHWEGDTLVVETANFNDKSWAPLGRPHTEQMRVVERFRRPDEGHLEFEFTVDDPATFTKSWTVKSESTLLAGDEIGEYVCTENEQDTTHYKPN